MKEEYGTRQEGRETITEQNERILSNVEGKKKEVDEARITSKLQ